MDSVVMVAYAAAARDRRCAARRAEAVGARVLPRYAGAAARVGAAKEDGGAGVAVEGRRAAGASDGADGDACGAWVELATRGERVARARACDAQERRDGCCVRRRWTAWTL